LFGVFHAFLVSFTQTETPATMSVTRALLGLSACIGEWRPISYCGTYTVASSVTLKLPSATGGSVRCASGHHIPERVRWLEIGRSSYCCPYPVTGPPLSPSEQPTC
jgi:hypothetical protein